MTAILKTKLAKYQYLDTRMETMRGLIKYMLYNLELITALLYNASLAQCFIQNISLEGQSGPWRLVLGANFFRKGDKRAIQRLIIWLAPWAGKINQIARCDWLPKRARWSHLARSGLPTVSRKQNFPKSYIINRLLTNLFSQDGWILPSFFFCVFMDLDFVSVHKHAKQDV